MKILLITLNAKFIHSSLALRCLRANIPENSDDCEILELTINNRPEEILAEIYRRKPDVVGLSCYIWNIRMLLEAADELKKIMPHVKIIAGGPEVEHCVEEILRNHKIDFIVTGEGENIFAKLIERKFNPRFVDGVAYLEDGRMISSAAPLPDFNQLRFAYSGMEALAGSGLENRIIYYEASRGCPYACAYCMSALAGKVRRLSLETACQQLEALISMKPSQIKFVDRTFNSDRRYAYEIWQYLIENDNSVTNFHFEIAGGLLDADALALLGTARPGLFQFEIGVQSVNPQTLAAIKRPDNLEKWYVNARQLIENRNIHIHLDLIAGLPYEDFYSFRGSFNAVYSLSPHMLQLGFLKLLKGSSLRVDAEQYQITYKTTAPYEVLSTAWLTFDDILRLKRIEDALEVCYNSGQFRGTVKFLEQFYETPFDLYDIMAHKLRFGEGVNRAKPRLVRELYEFGVSVCGNEKKLRDLLRFDLCLSESPRAMPDWLRGEVPIEVKKKMGIPKRGDIALEKFSYSVHVWLNSGTLEEQETYILFDYSCRPLSIEKINCSYREVYL